MTPLALLSSLQQFEWYYALLSLLSATLDKRKSTMLSFMAPLTKRFSYPNHLTSLTLTILLMIVGYAKLSMVLSKSPTLGTKHRANVLFNLVFIPPSQTSHSSYTRITTLHYTSLYMLMIITSKDNNFIS